MGSQAVAAHRAMKVEARHNTAQVGEDHVFVSADTRQCAAAQTAGLNVVAL